MDNLLSQTGNDVINQALSTFIGFTQSLGSMEQTNGGYSNNTGNALSVAPFILNSSSSEDSFPYVNNVEMNNVMKGLFYQMTQIIDMVSKKTFDEFTEEEVESLVQEAEEFGRDWIYENYGKHEIMEDGDLIITRVIDKIADFLDGLVHDSFDFNDFPSAYEAAVETIIERVNMDSVLSVIEEIMQAPTTMAEKLRDIGMSQSDFI